MRGEACICPFFAAIVTISANGTRAPTNHIKIFAREPVPLKNSIALLPVESYAQNRNTITARQRASFNLAATFTAPHPNQSKQRINY